MKAEKYRKALERHPYLRWMLRVSSDLQNTVSPCHVHFITVRPLSSLPEQTFSTIQHEDGETMNDFWVMEDAWTVVLLMKEGLEKGISGLGYRYCEVPRTYLDARGKRQFRSSGGENDWAHPDMTADDVRRYWGQYFSKWYAPKFVAVVNIKRSWGFAHKSFAPARVTIYQ